MQMLLYSSQTCTCMEKGPRKGNGAKKERRKHNRFFFSLLFLYLSLVFWSLVAAGGAAFRLLRVSRTAARPPAASLCMLLGAYHSFGPSVRSFACPVLLLSLPYSLLRFSLSLWTQMRANPPIYDCCSLSSSSIQRHLYFVPPPPSPVEKGQRAGAAQD